jgi:hypothetical protein
MQQNKNLVFNVLIRTFGYDLNRAVTAIYADEFIFACGRHVSSNE